VQVQDVVASGHGKSGFADIVQLKPSQQAFPPVQDAFSGTHAPGSQVQGPPPGGHEQPSPVQHSLPPCVHACATPEHVVLGAQAPAMHSSPSVSQHGVVLSHA
jgi:hypothetical protein